MRTAFIKALCEEAEKNKDIWLLSGDIGFSVLEGFAARFPDRFVNVGVAEQNMIGIAAGLAQSGKTVFTYTIGNFAFMRCMEQIRNELCYHNLNVKVVAVGGGYSYGSMGYTHHAIEDLAMLTVLPNLRVVAPGDPVEASVATHWLCREKGPGYLRLGRGGEPVVHAANPDQITSPIVLAKGEDAVIISSAGTLDIASAAVKALSASGLAVGLISMPLLSPFNDKALLKEISHASSILTVEEHGRGGLGSLVSECVLQAQLNVRLQTLRITLGPCKEAGDRNWQRERQGLTVDGIVKGVKEMMRKHVM